jgi:hypothetical protein
VLSANDQAMNNFLDASQSILSQSIDNPARIYLLGNSFAHDTDRQSSGLLNFPSSSLALKVAQRLPLENDGSVTYNRSRECIVPTGALARGMDGWGRCLLITQSFCPLLQKDPRDISDLSVGPRGNHILISFSVHL